MPDHHFTLPSGAGTARGGARRGLAPRARRTGVAAVLGFAALSAVAPSPAAAAGRTDCRASAARVTLLDRIVVEPVRANALSTPCSTQSAETLSPTSIGPLRAAAVVAYTGARGPANGALSGVAGANLTLGSANIAVRTLTAETAASCASGNPVLSGRSRVVGLTVNGQGITLPADDRPFALNLGPVSIKANQTTRSGSVLTQRALEVNVQGAGNVVLAESRSGTDKAACAGGGGDGPFPRACPAGSSLDFERGVCIIRETRSDGSTRIIVVGRPYTGPRGGTVVGLETARKRYTSKCLSGPGAAYAVIGSNRGDRITGTNGPDRILSRAGNDRVEGSRSADCIDAGTGNDGVTGGTGNDRAYGSFGNDRVTGGGHSDRLSGGSGRDTVQGNTGNDVLFGNSGNDKIRAGHGADRLHGGSGNDSMSTYVMGPRARMIDGGSGRDRAEINRSERSRTRSVERMVFLHPRRR